jgi:PAS domain S-box-containing protein
MNQDHPDFYRSLIDGIPEALIAAKPDGTIVFSNAAAERLTGYTLADVKDKPITILVPQREDRRADPVKWLQRWASEPDDVQSRFLDLIGRTKEGEDIPFGVRVRATNINGEELFLITFRDVSARKAEQAEFREAHLRATRILQIAEDAIISIDQSQNITFFNLKAEETFGYKSEDVIGKSIDSLLPENARRGHGKQITAFGASKQPSRLMSERGEVQGLRKNGEVFPIEAAITSVEVHGQRTFTAHIRDITARKQAQAELVESELRFRAIFDNAYEAIGLLTPEGVVLEFNKAAKSLTEGDAPLTGLPLWDLPWFGEEEDPASNQEGRSRLKDAVALGGGGEISRFEASITKPGGDTRTIDFNLIPVKDNDGNVVFLLAEGRDITDRT